MLAFAQALARTATTHVRHYGRSAQPSWTYLKKVLNTLAVAEAGKLSCQNQKASDLG